MKIQRTALGNRKIRFFYLDFNRLFLLQSCLDWSVVLIHMKSGNNFMNTFKNRRVWKVYSCKQSFTLHYLSRNQYVSFFFALSAWLTLSALAMIMLYLANTKMLFLKDYQKIMVMLFCYQKQVWSFSTSWSWGVTSCALVMVRKVSKEFTRISFD